MDKREIPIQKKECAFFVTHKESADYVQASLPV